MMATVSTTATTSRAPARTTPTSRRRDWAAPVAGLVATATALGISELLAGLLPGATSLVAAVGQVVVDLQPPGAKDFVVGLFGTNDKLALELFIVAVALLLGALLGIVARRRYEVAAGAFIAFGVVGFLAALGDPLVNPAVAAVAAAISHRGRPARPRLTARPIAPGAGPLVGQERPGRGDARLVAPLVHDPGAARSASARSRSASSAATCSSASAPHRSVTAQPCRRPRPRSRRFGPDADLSTNVPGLTPIVMPNDRFYRIDTSLLTPIVDTSTAGRSGSTAWSIARRR